MNILIMAIEARKVSVEQMLTSVQAEVIWDKELKGTYNALIRALQVPNEGYRLQMEDDVIIPPAFMEYLPTVEQKMIDSGWDVLSLFAPRRKALKESYDRGEQYVKFHPYRWSQATVYSDKALKGILQHAEFSRQTKHSDVLVSDWLIENKIPAYVHLPSIVQHNVWLGSTMGHSRSSQRMSDIYDSEFCQLCL